MKIRKLEKFLKKRLQHAGLSKVILERTGEKVRLNFLLPGLELLLARKVLRLRYLKKDLEKLINSQSYYLIFKKFGDLKLMPSLLLIILPSNLFGELLFVGQ